MGGGGLPAAAGAPIAWRDCWSGVQLRRHHPQLQVTRIIGNLVHANARKVRDRW